MVNRATVGRVLSLLSEVAGMNMDGVVRNAPEVPESLPGPEKIPRKG